MISMEYVGDDRRLFNQGALGRYDIDGEFVVQCHGKIIRGTSVRSLMIGGLDWCYGWHRSPRRDWTFSNRPAFIGSRDECNDYIRDRVLEEPGMTFTCFLDDTKWVVFEWDG